MLSNRASFSARARSVCVFAQKSAKIGKVSRTFEEEEIIDLEVTKTNIANIENELVEIKSKMSGYLRELGL